MEKDVEALQLALSRIDWAEIDAHAAEGRKKGLFFLLVYELNRTKLHIYSNEGSHKTPHFHIEYKREFSAAYEIATLRRIVGEMPRRYEEPIIEWAKPRRDSLMGIWQQVATGGSPLVIEKLQRDE